MALPGSAAVLAAPCTGTALLTGLVLAVRSLMTKTAINNLPQLQQRTLIAIVLSCAVQAHPTHHVLRSLSTTCGVTVRCVDLPSRPVPLTT
jgi:hypothetical protein